MRGFLFVLFWLCLVISVSASVTGKGSSGPSGKDNQAKLQGEFYRGEKEEPRYSKSCIQLTLKIRHPLEPVLQGETVAHDFILKNTTDKPIEFGRVKSCCGVILTGHQPKIQPGEEGKISVIILTDKFGGKTVKGTLNAELIQPAGQKIAIDISLFVKKTASVSQHMIVLEGSCTKPLEGQTIIVPEKDFPFTVQGIKARKGLHIEYEYKTMERKGRKEYMVVVRNTMKTPGIYRDMLYVHTDNPKQPELRIRVEGRITD